MKRPLAFVPLIIGLLFTLALSLIPIRPALGDNIGACQGTTTSGKVSMGGRVITPSLILRTSDNQPCAANETSLSLVSLSRTIIVSPNGTPLQNGTALLTARDVISNSNPSADNPWLLKLEPGNYDLGNQALNMLPFVDMEGSGEGTTIISSTIGSNTFPPSNATLVAASSSEVRALKITNFGAGSFRAAVYVPVGTTNARFIHFTAAGSTSNSSTNSFGFSNSGNSVTLVNSTIMASGSGGNTGLFQNLGTLTATNSTFLATGAGNGGAYSLIYNGGAYITIGGSTLNASGGVENIGLYGGGTVTVTNSTLNASGGSNNSGISSSGGTISVTNSTATASGGTAYGFRNSGTAKVASSQLYGSTAASNGLTVCPFSVNAVTFVPLNASCQ